MRNYDDVIAQMQAVGLRPEGLEFGRIVRCRAEGRKGKPGWYALHLVRSRDGDELIVGSFGEWQGANKTVYKVELGKAGKLDEPTREAMKKRIAEDRRRAEAMRKAEADRAARKAAWAWSKMAATGESEYLRLKGVGAHGVRFTPNGGSVVVPVYKDGAVIRGLEIIRGPKEAARARRPKKEFWPAGMEKSGNYHLVGVPRDIILVAEGYATAASLFEATGIATAVAFDAGNLAPVCKNLRRRYKRARLLICADDDTWTDGNPGVTKAKLAALECDGEVLIPQWPDPDERERALERGEKWTDFNDLANSPAGGLPLVRIQVEDRLRELGWQEPRARAPATTPRGGGGDGGGRPGLQPIDDLEELLDRFVMIYAAGGQVFDRQEHIMLKLTDMKDLCRRRELYNEWLAHPRREVVRLDEVGFDPTGKDRGIKCNLWKGWPTTPVAGRCQKLLDLLAHLCSGERNAAYTYAWVLKWLAYPLQNPGAKMKTALVMHGPQGTGKNLFFESIMAIYGEHGRVIGQRELETPYNSWASRLLFLLADELVARSDVHVVKNQLKSLITGDWIEINPKFLASYRERNHCNIVFLSNETLPVVIEQDDRRHAVIWTPGKLEPAFYQEVLDEIASGGVAALHQYLLELPLGDFHPGTPPPETEARRDLIEQSLDSTDRFFLELVDGELEPVSAKPCLSRDLYRLYQTWCTRKGHKPAPEPRLLSALKKRHDVKTGRERYVMPGKPPSRNPHGCLFIGPRDPMRDVLLVPDCPPGKARGEWLGDCFSAFQREVNEFRGVGFDE